ncbi:MAG: DUF2461 domain-containing protein [Pseudomonadota bacterium]
MADGFEALVDSAQAFFTELQANNEKAWFEPRKAHYTAEIRKPGELFADLMAEDLSRRTGHAMKPKVFRIHRDVRFSKDKSPYNAHLHMLWSAGLDSAPAYFFAVEPDSVWMGMGLFASGGEMLSRYRRFVDAHGDDLQAALNDLHEAHGTTLSNYGPEPLKRVPKPYDPDHPHGDLLKRKSLTLGTALNGTWRSTGLLKSTEAMAEAYLPLWRLITDRL